MDKKQFSLPALSGRAILRQAVVGCAGGWTLTTWVETRRLSSGVDTFIVWSILAVAVWALTVRKTDSDRERKASAVVNAFVVVGVFAMVLAIAERLYFVNAATYPAWLTQGDLGALNFNQLVSWQEAHKCLQGEHEHKEDGRDVFRCGGILWPTSSTYYLNLNRTMESQ